MIMNKPNKKQVIGIVFLTLFITAGAFAYQVYNCSIDERADYISQKVADKLDLQEHQKQKLEIVKKQLLSTFKQVKQGRQQHHEKVLKLIASKQFNRDSANQLLTDKTQQINTEGSPIIAAFADFYDSLDTTQQQLIRDKISDHSEHSHYGFSKKI